MKYKLIKTDLFLNGKLIPEGSTIELPEKEASSLSVYLEELKEIQPKQIDETNSQDHLIQIKLKLNLKEENNEN